MDQLTPEDYASVESAMRAVGRRSLNELVAEWADLVSQVENGYAWTSYEYRNELGCRDALQRAWPLLTPRVRALRADEVDRLDARFRAATTLDSSTAIDDDWWMGRQPSRTGEQW